MLTNNEIKLPLEIDLLKIDDITKELTSYYRLNRYEISNYAKNGYECKHNLGYWSDVPYIGFGLNSSSYYDKKRFKNKSFINDYLSLNYDKYIIEKDKSIYYDNMQNINEIDHMNEYIMLGFRKSSGINIDEFNKLFDYDFEKTFGTALKIYQGMGMVNKKENSYFFTDAGFNVSNRILSDLLISE